MAPLSGLADFFISSSPGFIQGQFETVRDELVAWRAELGYEPVEHPLSGSLDDRLLALNPLISGARPRELLVRHGSWVAYFDCFVASTDPAGPCEVLAKRLGTQALQVTTCPVKADFKGMAMLPGLQFHLWGPSGYVRALDLIQESRWVFDESGDPLDFEESENYTRGRVKDRLTVGMLERYCAALGIDLRNEQAYGPEAVLIETKVVIPAGHRKVWV